jgi:hypothetical protein
MVKKLNKDEVVFNINKLLEQINGMYDFIDEANGYLDELITYGDNVINATDNDIDDKHYTTTYDRINDFYMNFPTYNCLDDFKDLLNLLKEDLQEKVERVK